MSDCNCYQSIQLKVTLIHNDILREDRRRLLSKIEDLTASIEAQRRNTIAFLEERDRLAGVLRDILALKAVWGGSDPIEETVDDACTIAKKALEILK